MSGFSAGSPEETYHGLEYILCKYSYKAGHVLTKVSPSYSFHLLLEPRLKFIIYAEAPQWNENKNRFKPSSLDMLGTETLSLFAEFSSLKLGNQLQLFLMATLSSNKVFKETRKQVFK